jgi:formate hydrogenlyase subunit 3/multisubunit Na+/H+ antiporter MnhD subunit
MKNTDIESLLRENKPQVKDNPTFLLEVQQKMRAVDGIKSEVDRQRRYGHQALMIALVAGLILGGIVATLAYLDPINTEMLGESLIADIKMALDPWKHYVLIFMAICAITLGVIYSVRKENTIRL